jgi:hypothetical protein
VTGFSKRLASRSERCSVLDERKYGEIELKASDLIEGKQYVLDDGKTVEFAYLGGTGKAIVHPPGEPDMQSSMAVEPEELYEVGAPRPVRTRLERIR